MAKASPSPAERLDQLEASLRIVEARLEILEKWTNLVDQLQRVLTHVEARVTRLEKGGSDSPST